MKRIAILFALSVSTLCASAQTTTPNLGLALPSYATQNWNVPLNGNMTIIDTAVGRLQVPFQGAWSGTAVYSRGDQVSYLGSEYVSLINSNFDNLPTNAHSWMSVPGSGGFTAGGDLSGTSTSQTVQGILGHALPALASGYPHWNGSAWVFDTPSAAPIPINIITGATATASSSIPAEYFFNDNATAAAAVTLTLPTAIAGYQKCTANGNNGSAADNGTLTIQTSAAGQYIVFTDGTLSASGGYVISAGAAGDAACVIGIDSTHWMLFIQRGTWTEH